MGPLHSATRRSGPIALFVLSLACVVCLGLLAGTPAAAAPSSPAEELDPSTELVLRFAPGQAFYAWCGAAQGTMEETLAAAEIKIKYAEAYKQADGQLVSEFSLAKSYAYSGSGYHYGLSGELTGSNSVSINGLFSWNTGAVIGGSVNCTMAGSHEYPGPQGADNHSVYAIVYNGNLWSAPFVDTTLPGLLLAPAAPVTLRSLGVVDASGDYGSGVSTSTFDTEWTITVKSEGIPPGMAKVDYAGNAWISRGGSQDYVPLTDGDLLEPGCRIRVPTPEESGVGGGQGTPAGGWRVVLTFGKGFRCTVEPGSVVEIFDWGARVESGSIEMEDDSNRPGRATTETGMCSGKDPDAAQLPFSVQAQAAAAPTRNRYRVEITAGQTKISALAGGVEVESPTTHAKALLRAGQYITVTSQGLGPVSEKAFTDVPSSHPYRTAILGMALKEIVNGYEVGSTWEFRPNDSVKRAQFAKMIVGTMSLPPKTSPSTRFADLGVPDAAGYPHIFVQAAYEAGITQGTNQAQTTFAPWDPIKRAQVVTMIVRAANRLWPGLLETPPPAWSGVMASFTDPNHGANMRIAEYNGLLARLENFDRSWDPWKQATRGEVAQMLWNLMTK